MIKDTRYIQHLCNNNYSLLSCPVLYEGTGKLYKPLSNLFVHGSEE